MNKEDMVVGKSYVVVTAPLTHCFKIGTVVVFTEYDSIGEGDTMTQVCSGLGEDGNYIDQFMKLSDLAEVE